MFVEIPTDVRQPSMNLGQAVAVCLYELAAGLRSEPTIGETTTAPGDDAGRENAAGHLAGIDKDREPLHAVIAATLLHLSLIHI